MNSLLVVFIVLAFVLPAQAAETSVDTSNGKSQGKDRALSLKNSIENKVSSLKSMGNESTRNHSDKHGGSFSGGGGIDISIPARALLAEEIVYKLPVDFGLAASMDGGLINTSAQEFLSQAAKSGARVADIANEADVRSYLHAVARFGARAGQAQIYLNDWIKRIGKIRKGKNAEYEVDGLGLDDLITLAAGAWIQSENIVDQRILYQLSDIISDKSECRLVGDATTVQCGKTVLYLTAPPSLKHKGIMWYGDAFAGVHGIYKVNSSWSWSRALENTVGSSSFVKNQADELETTGQAFDAVMTRKTAVERSRSNKTNLGPGKFLPK